MKVEYIVKYNYTTINTFNKALAVKLASRNNGTIQKVIKTDTDKSKIDIRR